MKTALCRKCCDRKLTLASENLVPLDLFSKKLAALNNRKKTLLKSSVRNSSSNEDDECSCVRTFPPILIVV